MNKGTTIKDALAKFEEKTNQKACDAEFVCLSCQIPSLEKMDASLSTLTNCIQLSLSTNQIEKIANLNGLKNLRILSLARNNIKSLSGLEAVGETLTELWISYNLIDKLKGIGVLKKLQVLNMTWNKVSDQNEFLKLMELVYLEKLTFIGNPFAEQDVNAYKHLAHTKLKNLSRLDGQAVIRDEDEDENKKQGSHGN